MNHEVAVATATDFLMNLPLCRYLAAINLNTSETH